MAVKEDEQKVTMESVKAIKKEEFHVLLEAGC
jgi:hypothetical protein